MKINITPQVHYKSKKQKGAVLKLVAIFLAVVGLLVLFYILSQWPPLAAEIQKLWKIKI